MTSRQELKQSYRERERPAGVFQVKNTATGRALLGSSLNLDGALNRHRFMLTIGAHPNKELQADWSSHGPDAFVFEVIDVVKVSDAPGFKPSDELALLEQIWIEELQPFGERGYNRDAKQKIRQA